MRRWRPSPPGAEAHLTGELAVCAGSCGPGNLHLINGLFDCHRNRVPVLAIAAHIPSSEIGRGYFQETHPQTLFQECSHYCELVSDPAQLPGVLEIAMREAVAKRGVAVVVIPGDVALKEIGDRRHSPFLLPAQPVVVPAKPEIERAAALLNEARRVTLFCGRGCAGAHDALMGLAETLKSPIVHAFGGKEFVEYDNPYDVGMTGLIGFSSGYYRHDELRRAADAGHGLPVPPVLSGRCAHHPGRHPGRGIWAGAAAWSWAWSAMCARPSRRCCRGWRSRTTASISTPRCRTTSSRARGWTTSRPARRAGRRSTRNTSPSWSATWPTTTRSSPSMSARRRCGRRAISRSTASGG